MDLLNRVVFLLLLAGAATCCKAGETEHEVTREQIDAHVRAQFEQFGPQSKQNEYFGYVYRCDGEIASAVVRGPPCSSTRNCGLDTAAAARLIPAGARILGEWHTHPHLGSSQLSHEDVRGAHANRHIDGYKAYYSMPNGDIFAWDPRYDWVPAAMVSIVLIGNYRTATAVLVQHARRNAEARSRKSVPGGD